MRLREEPERALHPRWCAHQEHRRLHHALPSVPWARRREPSHCPPAPGDSDVTCQQHKPALTVAARSPDSGAEASNRSAAWSAPENAERRETASGEPRSRDRGSSVCRAALSSHARAAEARFLSAARRARCDVAWSSVGSVTVGVDGSARTSASSGSSGRRPAGLHFAGSCSQGIAGAAATAVASIAQGERSRATTFSRSLEAGRRSTRSTSRRSAALVMAGGTRRAPTMPTASRSTPTSSSSSRDEPSARRPDPSQPRVHTPVGDLRLCPARRPARIFRGAAENRDGG